MTGDGAVALCGELIGREGGLRGVIDGNDVEVDGVRDSASIAIGDEVVKASYTIEVVVGGEGVLIVVSVVSELTVADGEVDDIEVVNIA